MRPGPPSISPSSAPGGVVVHVYSVPSERLLLVQLIGPGDDVDHAATVAAGQAMTLAQLEHEPDADGLCLVAYDGDDGSRMAW